MGRRTGPTSGFAGLGRAVPTEVLAFVKATPGRRGGPRASTVDQRVIGRATMDPSHEILQLPFGDVVPGALQKRGERLRRNVL